MQGPRPVAQRGRDLTPEARSNVFTGREPTEDPACRLRPADIVADG